MSLIDRWTMVEAHRQTDRQTSLDARHSGLGRWLRESQDRKLLNGFEGQPSIGHLGSFLKYSLNFVWFFFHFHIVYSNHFFFSFQVCRGLLILFWDRKRKYHYSYSLPLLSSRAPLGARSLLQSLS